MVIENLMKSLPAIAASVLLMYGMAVAAVPSGKDVSSRSKRTVLYFRIYDPDGRRVDDATIVLYPNSPGYNDRMDGADESTIIWSCQYDSATARFIVIAHPSAFEEEWGIREFPVRLTITHPKYGEQIRTITTICEWPSRNTVDGESVPDVNIHIGRMGDEGYADGCRIMPYTPRPDIICVVTDHTSRELESLRLGLFDSLGLVDIAERPVEGLNLYGGRSFREVAERGIRFFRKRDGSPFSRESSPELAALRTSGIIDAAGPVIIENGVITKAYDHRLLVHFRDDDRDLDIPSQFKRLGLRPDPGQMNPNHYHYWYYADADPQMGEGISDRIGALAQSSDVVAITSRIIAVVW